MPPEEFKNKIKEIFDTCKEEGHQYADNLMCDLLISLGYEEGINIFLNSDKWYD